MKEVKIEIENTELAELGVDQPIMYTTLRFCEAHFLGYFVQITDPTVISFYLGSQVFVCKNTVYNVQLFESIMK